MLADILTALDSGDLAVLTLLDFSTAFDSVDHSTLLRRLQATYRLNEAVINCFTSYLSSQLHHVRISMASSSPSAVQFEAPQGSVLGPILLLLFTADLLQLVSRHLLHPHAFADDTQIYGFCKPSTTDILSQSLSACVNDASRWLRQIGWCWTWRKYYDALPLGTGISSQLSRLVSVTRLPCRFQLSGTWGLRRCLRHYEDRRHRDRSFMLRCVAADSQCCRSLPRHALLALIRDLVGSKVDYCISALAGITGHLMDKLQSVLNAAARLVFSARKSEHITLLLRELHWLRVPERIQFRL